jgi:hypothetical protein
VGVEPRRDAHAHVQHLHVPRHRSIQFLTVSAGGDRRGAGGDSGGFELDHRRVLWVGTGRRGEMGRVVYIAGLGLGRGGGSCWETVAPRRAAWRVVCFAWLSLQGGVAAFCGARGS